MPNREQVQQQKEQPAPSQAVAVDTPAHDTSNLARRKKMVWVGVALLTAVLIGMFAAATCFGRQTMKGPTKPICGGTFTPSVRV